MGQFRTHYDNLQVSRNAAPEVIWAAYRALSLKYDAGANGGDARCVGIMRVVNKAYAVLSDPARRSEHDAWIVMKEAAVGRAAGRSDDDKPLLRTWLRIMIINGPRRILGFLRRFGAQVVLAGIVVLIGFLAISKLWPGHQAQQRPSIAKLHEVEAAPVATPSYVVQNGEPATVIGRVFGPSYVRPALTPYNTPWPTSAGYIAGAPRKRTDGLSSVEIGNDRNGTDEFVELVAIEGHKVEPVRRFFIPAYSHFTVSDIDPGEYDVRFKDLSSGQPFGTERFRLEQVYETDGTRFNDINITLYTVPNGNTKHHPISDAEFDLLLSP